MVRTSHISAKQAVVLLAMLRVFDLLTFAPATRGAENAATALIALPLSYLLLGVVLLPALLLLSRSRGCNLIDCALGLHPLAGKTVALLLFFYMVLVAADTTANFEFLLTSAVYPEVAPRFFILTLLLVCSYAAFLGLEAVTRVNTFLFFSLLLAVLFLSFALLPQADFLFLKTPFAGGAKTLLQSTIAKCFANFDVLLWLLLAPDLIGDLGKSVAGWALTTLALAEYLIALLAVGLGDYAKGQMFPFYALTAVAEISIFQRLDSLHIMLWTFIAFVKVAIYLYFAANCLGYLLPRRFKKTGLAICGVLAAATALFCSAGMRRLEFLQGILRSGITVALLAVLVPSVLLLWSLLKRKGVHS